MSETMDYPQSLADLHPLELHYFRIPRERWELMLTRLHQMGANGVSTLVPWSWHAPRAGIFDLTGMTHPARDVVGFMDACSAMGFRVILRVGPYVGAGLLGGGVPGWLLREHPQIYALRPDSQPWRDPASGSPLPSAEHPTYLKYVASWYQELTGALAARQSPEGTIVALRVDGFAPSAAQPSAGGLPAHWDYNPHVVNAQWPVWLRQQYAGIDALNAAWGTAYRSFNDAAFPRQPSQDESAPRHADAARFVTYAAAHALKTYAHMVGEMGWNVPIPTSLGEWPKADVVQVAHAVQVDPELPEVGASIRWAMDAPLRADGYPQRRFWAVKAALWEMQDGVKHIEGGILVTGPESRAVRLPRPTGDCAVYRLLLDGGLLDVPCRARAGMLYLDYPAADEAGETDLVFICARSSGPLPVFLRDYLTSLLLGRAQTLQRVGGMCQTLARALSDVETAASAAPPHPIDDLRAAERDLAEARLAARRAAASVGQLQRLAGDIRGVASAAHPTLIGLAAFTPQEMERLVVVRDACARAAPALAETARSITALCQAGKADMTVQAYRAAFEQALATAREADESLSGALRTVRADLAAGALSVSAWPVQDRLTRILQGLAAGLLCVSSRRPAGDGGN